MLTKLSFYLLTEVEEEVMAVEEEEATEVEEEEETVLEKVPYTQRGESRSSLETKSHLTKNIIKYLVNT
jgi:hypothetical protein